MNVLNRIDDALARFEGWVLVLLVISMTGFSFLQVILRNFLQTGLFWADPLNRHLVLWVGFLGASLATKRGKHITIDVLSRVIPASLKPFVDLIINIFGTIISAILADAAFEYIGMEKEMRTTLFLNIPTWVVLGIVPAGFVLIAARFLLHSVRCAVMIVPRGRA